MTSTLLRNISICSVIILAACGGGGGSNGSSSGGSVASSKPAPSKPTPANPTPSKPAATPSYKALLAQQTSIAEDYVGYGYGGYSVNATQDYQMPTSGTATYKGAGSYSPSSIPIDNAPIIGKAVLRANFGNDKLTGKVTDFKAASGHQTTGGTLNVNTNIASADITGRITGDLNLDGRSIKIDDKAYGSFLGDDADAVAIISGKGITSGSNHNIMILGEK